ncbi:hypothetical protein ES332_D09G067900v1 [Gossypium tomentosum]|uniref:S-protein homolog n=1 Tax=Gossypium tomentosum TaxID=34277 RepID=A0A5D2JDM7_GOSTO|nr:hypothetical protein ES332_D09G067900v1 [Gossypium tomentosum]
MASKVEKRGLMALILVLVISSLPEPALCIYWNWKFHVHLVNAMSDNSKPLMVHLKSKDNDLQEHPLWKNGDFQFHFKINFWETTLFYCTFKHGTETKVFNIFVHGDRYSESKVCKKPNKTVYWKVQDDGFLSQL